MKPSPLRVGCLGLVLMACGPDSAQYAELDDICGAPSPFRVLEIAPDEAVRGTEILRVQDRVFYVVSPLDADDPANVYLSTGESSVWTTGPCGESPARVATGVDDIFTLDRWPDLVFGCERATGDVLVLDPEGAQEPHVAFAGLSHGGYGCGLLWTDVGALSLDEHDDEVGALVLHPFPDDPRTGLSVPEVLIDPVRVGPIHLSGPGLRGDVLRAYADHVLALTPGGELVRVELAERSVTTLQTGVAGFQSSREGQYIVWQDAAVTTGDPVHPEGLIFLRDQAAGSDALLGEGALGRGGFTLWWAESGLVVLGFNPLNANSEPLRVFLLPGLESVDMPQDMFFNVRLADGRWVGGSVEDKHLDVIEFPRGERTRLFPRPAAFAGSDSDDAIRALELPEGPLWRVPTDGSAPTRLADRATRFMTYLDDGRIVGPVGVGPDSTAALVLVEPESLAELRIDDRVHQYSIDPTRLHDEGIVAYSVSDGDRSGVYLARLPAQPRSRAAARPAGEALVFDEGSDGPLPAMRSLDAGGRVIAVGGGTTRGRATSSPSP